MAETAKVSPRQVKARRGKPPTSAKTAEQRLLTALQEHPGASVITLASASGTSRSAAGERLRVLARRGIVEKDAAGRWRLKAEEARTVEEEARPFETSPS